MILARYPKLLSVALDKRLYAIIFHKLGTIVEKLPAQPTVNFHFYIEIKILNGPTREREHRRDGTFYRESSLCFTAR